MNCIRCNSEMIEVEVISRGRGNKVLRLEVIPAKTTEKVRIITPGDRFPVVRTYKCPECGRLEFTSEGDPKQLISIK
ncbi:MAG: hypothetical protein JXA22_00035 [Candidatus Thermoplasmatota archaeon]|nr:hypothetical protein [Candidatus Thermoplasmatota archaeon]